MKKIILALSLFLLLSCSNDPDRNGIFITPSWIQGSWKKMGTNDILKFTKRDIIINKYSFSNQSRTFTSRNIQVIANTPTSYVVDLFQTPESMPTRFVFIKKSETMMESKGYLPGKYIKEN